MKWIISVVMLFGIVGCSCTCKDSNVIEDGTYTFAHLEYYENGKTKTNDCSDLSTLPEGKKTICKSKWIVMTIKDNAYTFSMTEGHLVSGYYKLDDDKIYVSSEEDGEYKYTGWMHYRNEKVYYGVNDVYLKGVIYLVIEVYMLYKRYEVITL